MVLIVHSLIDEESDLMIREHDFRALLKVRWKTFDTELRDAVAQAEICLGMIKETDIVE